MGQPPITKTRVQETHAALTVAYGATGSVPRDTFDRALCMTYGFGIENCYKLAKTGELLGYWTRHRSKDGSGGTIRLLPTPPAPTPEVACSDGLVPVPA